MKIHTWMHTRIIIFGSLSVESKRLKPLSYRTSSRQLLIDGVLTCVNGRLRQIDINNSRWSWFRPFDQLCARVRARAQSSTDQ